MAAITTKAPKKYATLMPVKRARAGCRSPRKRHRAAAWAASTICRAAASSRSARSICMRTVSHAGGFRPGRAGVTCTHMQPVGTVVALGAGPTRGAAQLDATTLACDILPFGDDLFPRIKRAEAGSLLILLAETADDPSLATAAKARPILPRRRGGGPALVLPALAAVPQPLGPGRLQRAQRPTGSRVLPALPGHAQLEAGL